jgi:hypothetical protein
LTAISAANVTRDTAAQRRATLPRPPGLAAPADPAPLNAAVHQRRARHARPDIDVKTIADPR